MRLTNKIIKEMILQELAASPPAAFSTSAQSLSSVKQAASDIRDTTTQKIVDIATVVFNPQSSISITQLLNTKEKDGSFPYRDALKKFISLLRRKDASSFQAATSANPESLKEYKKIQKIILEELDLLQEIELDEEQLVKLLNENIFQDIISKYKRGIIASSVAFAAILALKKGEITPQQVTMITTASAQPEKNIKTPFAQESNEAIIINEILNATPDSQAAFIAVLQKNGLLNPERFGYGFIGGEEALMLSLKNKKTIDGIKPGRSQQIDFKNLLGTNDLFSEINPNNFKASIEMGEGTITINGKEVRWTADADSEGRAVINFGQRLTMQDQVIRQMVKTAQTPDSAKKYLSPRPISSFFGKTADPNARPFQTPIDENKIILPLKTLKKIKNNIT